LPKAPVAVEWSSQSEQYVLKIPTTTLHRFAQAVLDTSLDEIRGLDQPSILSEPETRALVGLLEYIVLEQPHWSGLQSYQTFCHDAEELLASCLLLKRPRSSSKSIAGANGQVAPKYVREAEEYMRANIHRPLLLSEVAQSVGVSVRTLHKVFRDFRGTTPIALLQNLRLSAVRHDLLSATSGTRVADVALRWGFAHLGRFSMAYRRKFGEHPRQTIRR
jgi:AraC-like DNA-binding protein